MNRYTVTWQPEAEAELVALSLEAPDRNQLAAGLSGDGGEVTKPCGR